MTMLQALDDEGILDHKGKIITSAFFKETNFMMGYRRLSALPVADIVGVFRALAGSMQPEDVDLAQPVQDAVSLLEDKSDVSDMDAHAT